jgi:hypothetical protein
MIKKYYNLLYYFFYNLLRFNKDRYSLFSYLAQGVKNGGVTNELLEAILIEYKKSKNTFISKYIEKTLFYMQEEGNTDAEAFFNSGLINFREFKSIETISVDEPERAFVFINERVKSQNNLKWAVGMLFFPVLLVSFGYLIFQPELKDMAEQMLSPVNNISSKKIEIPIYLQDRTMFFTLFIGLLTMMFSFFGFIYYLQKRNIKLLFKLFKIKEQEFILNNFELLLSLLKSGQSAMKSIEILTNNENNDIVSKQIFEEMREGLKTGEVQIFEILSKYSIDPATISYIRSGEMNNYLIESLNMVIDYNKEKYDILTKRLTKILPLVGQIAMTIFILKPLLDIIIVTTTGTLDFEV